MSYVKTVLRKESVVPLSILDALAVLSSLNLSKIFVHTIRNI